MRNAASRRSDDRARLRQWGALLVGVLSGSCQSTEAEPQPQPQPVVAAAPKAELEPADPELDVLWAGCTEIRLPAREGQPMTCTMQVPEDPSEPILPLRLWLPSTVSEAVVLLEREPMTPQDEVEVDSGQSFTVVPGYAGRLEVSGRVSGSEVSLLRLDIEQRPRMTDPLKQPLDAAVGDAKAQQALEDAWRKERATGPSPWRHLLLTRYLQYVTFDQGRWEDSAALAMEAIALARTQGRVLAECDSGLSAAYLYAEYMGDNARASRILEQSCDPTGSVPDSTMKAGYYRSIVQLNQGRLWSARRSMERSLDIARRLGLYQWEEMTINLLAGALAEQGRFRWAEQLLERSHTIERSVRPIGSLRDCKTTGDYHTRRGQLAFREARLTSQPTAPARTHWTRAADIYADPGRCPGHAAVDNAAAGVQMKLARIDLDEGNPPASGQRLDAIDIASLTPERKIEYRLLAAELSLERGALAQVRRALDELDDGRLASTAHPRHRWRYFLLRARLHRKQGKTKLAIDALALAQRQLELEATATAVSTEADRYIAMRRQSGELLVRLLLAQGLVEPALCAARITRARVLVGPRPRTTASRRVSHRETLDKYAWYDPHDIPTDELLKIETGLDELLSVDRGMTEPMQCDDLPSPVEDEVVLLFFRDDEGWGGFAWNHEGRVVERPLGREPDHDDTAALGQMLLTPFEDLLRDAKRLRVLLPPELHDVSMPDLPWHGGSVGDAMPVVHALDLPSVPSSPTKTRGVALLFSDPRQKLLDDRQSLSTHFDRWASRLELGGLEIELDRSPSAANGRVSVEEVLRGTRGQELALLYGFGAQHRSRYDLLAPDGPSREPDLGTFDLGTIGLLRTDVLGEAGRVPRHVILAHCDSARIDPYGVSGAVGLAQSYVQAGSQWSVGTIGNVSPKSMKVVVDVLIDAYAKGSNVEQIAAALQESKRRLRGRELPDGEKLRLWVR